MFVTASKNDVPQTLHNDYADKNRKYFTSIRNNSANFGKRSKIKWDAPHKHVETTRQGKNSFHQGKSIKKKPEKEKIAPSSPKLKSNSTIHGTSTLSRSSRPKATKARIPHYTSTGTLRPLPPLPPLEMSNGRRAEYRSLHSVAHQTSQRVLPPIRSSHSLTRNDWDANHGHRQENPIYVSKRPGGRMIYVGERIRAQTSSADQQPLTGEDIIAGRNFIPFNTTSPINSESTSSTNSERRRLLSKTELVTSRHFLRDPGHQSAQAGPMIRTGKVDDSTLSAVGKRCPESMMANPTTTTPSTSLLSGDDGEQWSRDKDMRKAKAGEWVRSSTFAIDASYDFDFSHSSSTDNFSSTSSIPFDDGRAPKYPPRHRSTSFVHIREVLSNARPPPLPFRIVVHERAVKFNIDLKLRMQEVHEWWQRVRIPRPRVALVLTEVKDALSKMVARIVRPIWWPVPINDTPRRFVLSSIPSWREHRHISPKQLEPWENRRPLRPFMDNVENGLYSDDEEGSEDSDDDYYDDSNVNNTQRLLSSDSSSEQLSTDRVHSDRSRFTFTKPLMLNRGGGKRGTVERHVSFESADGRDDEDDHVPSRNKFSSDRKHWNKKLKRWRGRKTTAPQRDNNREQKELTLDEVHEKFNRTRNKLHFILEKMDDPAWYMEWIKKQDEMDRHMRAVNRKRLDLLRALAFTMEDAARQSSRTSGVRGESRCGRNVDTGIGIENRMRRRIHYQFAHHRLGIQARQPRNTISNQVQMNVLSSSPGHCYCYNDICTCCRPQPVYTDLRSGCVACRIMQAARLYGCDAIL